MAPSLKTVLPYGSPDASITKLGLVGIVIGCILLWHLGLVVYRVFLHPLARYPGPKLYAATDVPWVWRTCVKGTSTRKVLGLHRKYGPIVRVGPDTLAIDGSIAFPQIFQHQPGKPEWPKQRGFVSDNDELSLIGGTAEVHRRLRRQLSHAFSDSSMYEQEPVVRKYIDLLCRRLGEKAASAETFDVVPWLNFTSFDIIGDLMFADSFHSLEGGDYHPWVLSLFQGFRGSALGRAARQHPFIGPIISMFGGGAKVVAKFEETQKLANEKAMLRKAQGETPGGRRDFMTYMLKKNRDGQPGFSDLDILMNSPLLVAAGSETTATALSAFFWQMGQPRYRPIYQMLCDEIRSAFNSNDDINMKSVARLPYLQAVIEENLRLYPPAPETPPRISPGADVNGKFIPKGTAVIVYQVATNLNPDNFTDPDSFRPERWLPPTHPLYNPIFDKDNRAAFRPFSFGTRDCLGKNLAYSELRLIIASILHRFDFELIPGQDDWMSRQRVFILWEKPALKVIFRERQRQSKE